MTRKIVTSLHIHDTFICGIEPEPSEERVSLRARLHPGYGFLVLKCNGRQVRTENRDDATLQAYENRARRGPRSRWTLDVIDPMVCYRLTRRAHNTWVLTKSWDGFA